MDELRSHPAGAVAAASPSRPDAAIAEMLVAVREALHRRGRLSSRNEALDEVAKLLIAHVTSIRQGGDGIPGLRGRQVPAATALREFVATTLERHLPESLAHELPGDAFDLRLTEREDALAEELVAAFTPLTTRRDWADTDLLNAPFGSFLADSFGEEKELGQYLTPPEVVDMMVDLVLADMGSDEIAALGSEAPWREFGLVLDPSCGVGSFLAAFLRAAREVVRPADDVAWTRRMCEHTLVGIDKSERMVRLALANLASFGVTAAHLHLGSALADDGTDGQVASSLDGEVGLILTNPPFGAAFPVADLPGSELADRLRRSSTRTVNSEVLFVERYLRWLRPGGQLAAVVPDSVLTNGGVYRTLREQIRDRVDVRAVVSLPDVTFGAAGTTTKTSVLYLRRRRERGTATGPSHFVICRDVGYEVVTRGSQRTRVRTGPGDLPGAAARLREALATGTADGVRAVPDLEDRPRWDATYHASLPIRVQERLDLPGCEDLFVRDVADLVTDRVDPRRAANDVFDYLEISGVRSDTSIRARRVAREDAPSRARKPVRAGDVLVSTVRPDRRTIGIVREHQHGAICTTGFAVLRPRAIDPWALAALLRSDVATAQILRNNVGIAYPAVDETCLLDVLLPARREDMPALAEAAATIRVHERRLRASRQAFTRRVDGAAEAWSRSG